MVLSGIMTIGISILWNVILFQLGCIFTESEQLRRFLGLRTDEEQKHNYAYVTKAVELIGKLLIAYAIISILVSIVGGITVFLICLGFKIQINFGNKINQTRRYR